MSPKPKIVEPDEPEGTLPAKKKKAKKKEPPLITKSQAEVAKEVMLDYLREHPFNRSGAVKAAGITVGQGEYVFNQSSKEFQKLEDELLDNLEEDMFRSIAGLPPEEGRRTIKISEAMKLLSLFRPNMWGKGGRERPDWSSFREVRFKDGKRDSYAQKRLQELRDGRARREQQPGTTLSIEAITRDDSSYALGRAYTIDGGTQPDRRNLPGGAPPNLPSQSQIPNADGSIIETEE